ncbi:hypothetical protein QBC39DRAFT_12381 [Podospora conica]|nr:hypothetical protein QBC39DRAFT_12381 [Schizothecium conicum]
MRKHGRRQIGGFHVFFSSLLFLLIFRGFVFDAGPFPLFVLMASSIGFFSFPILPDTRGIFIFNLISPPPLQSSRQRPSLGRDLAPPPRHQREPGCEARPGDWIAFLDGQSRSAAPLLSPESSVLRRRVWLSFLFSLSSHHLTLSTRRFFSSGHRAHGRWCP